MSYNILKMHRRKLRKFEMDQLSEHIQQNLSKNFEYEDDEVIDRLRDVMYELRSNRLASPGPAPGMVNNATTFILITRLDAFTLTAGFFQHFSENLVGKNSNFVLPKKSKPVSSKEWQR